MLSGLIYESCALSPMECDLCNRSSVNSVNADTELVFWNLYSHPKTRGPVGTYEGARAGPPQQRGGGNRCVPPGFLPGAPC